jgi:autotransporter-associated beta strand protein
MQSAYADRIWTGTASQEWSDAANWGGALPNNGELIEINLATGNFPVITSANSATFRPGDVLLGRAPSSIARLDIRSGTLVQNILGNNGQWFFLGIPDSGTSSSTLNIADTSATGQSNITTFGQGSGGLTVGKLWVGWRGGLATNATVNINTTGTITATSFYDQFAGSVIVGRDSTGVINMASGTINAAAEVWLGFTGDGGATNLASGTFNQAGGTVNTLGVIGALGAATGTWNIGNGSDSATLNATGAVAGLNGFGDGRTGIVLGRGYNTGTTAQGAMTVGSGGTVNSTRDILLGFAGNVSTVGRLNINSGGTVNLGTTAESVVNLSQFDAARGELTIDGGTLNLNSNSDILFSTQGGIGTSFVTLKNGGQINSWAGNGSGSGLAATSVLDLNRSNANVNSTFNLDGGTLTISSVLSTGPNGTRVFNFNGGTLKASTANATFFAANSASAANVKLGGAIIDTNGFDNTIGQVLQHDSGLGATLDGGLTKNGIGTLTLDGAAANSYTGLTTVSGGSLKLNKSAGVAAIAGGTRMNTGGTLLLGAANQIADGSAMELNGGTFDSGGFSETVGTLTLTTTSTIDFGTSQAANTILAFANSAGMTWSGTLNIYNYSSSNTGDGVDQLIFGSDSTGLTTAQLDSISFYSAGNGSTLLGTGVFFGNPGEVTYSAVPEPATAFGAFALLGLAAFRETTSRRRKLAGRRA